MDRAQNSENIKPNHRVTTLTRRASCRQKERVEGWIGPNKGSSMGETGNEERDMEFRTGLVEFFTSPNPRCGDLKVLETNDHLLS